MDWVARAAAATPDAPAMSTPDRVITYRELDAAANAVASIIIGSGLEGSAVAFWGERDPATVAAVWGIPRAGATAIPVDSRWPPAETMRLTRRAGARGLWALPEGGIDRLLDRPVPPSSISGPEGDQRFVVFTSGSEGTHRAVVLSGRNISSSVEASRSRLGNGPGDSWLAVLPMFHVGGLSILWRQAEQGAPVVLEPRFDAGRVARLLGEVAFASLVPTMLRRTLDAGAAGGTDLRGVLIGGGPCPPALLAEALDRRIPALQTYGMTETCSQVCTVAPDRAREDLGTAGTPLPGSEIRIADDGRIEVRGPMVSSGYLDEPERPSDWFRTGDLGSVDARGRLTVTGRADSVIVTGGEMVFPDTVVNALVAHPGVREARVFGLPDDDWGRRVVAEVVLDGVTVDELQEWARGRLRAHEVPREWRPVRAVASKLV